MKKFAIALAALFASSMLLTACGGGSAADSDSVKNKPAEVKETKLVEPVAFNSEINVRFVDMEKVYLEYKLSKEVANLDSVLKMSLISTQQAKERAIQTKSTSIQQKLQSNQYASEDAYNADMSKLQGEYNKAQQDLASLETQSAKRMQQQATRLNDSIQNFINDYNKAKKYDAIIYKSATLTFNANLDITDEVIKGLNERYKDTTPKK